MTFWGCDRNAASSSSTSRKSFAVGSGTTPPCTRSAKRTPPRCRSTSCSYGSECAPLHVIILLPSSLPPVPGLMSMVLTCTAPRRLHGFGPPTKTLLESCESLRRSSWDPVASFYRDYVQPHRTIRTCGGRSRVHGQLVGPLDHPGPHNERQAQRLIAHQRETSTSA